MKLRSFRHCITYPRQRQLGRQPKNSKALLSQPSVTVFVGKALLLDFMAWTVNFDNQSMFAADEIKDSVAQGSLPLKLGAVASPVANCAPNKCLGLNGPRAMLARETAEYGAGDFFWHGGHDTRHSSRVKHTEPSRSARSPSSVVASQRHLPAQGGKGRARSSRSNLLPLREKRSARRDAGYSRAPYKRHDTA